MEEVRIISSTPRRIEWVDTAKGLGMALVMLGHAVLGENISDWVYSFHMPIFLFLTGYVFNYDPKLSVKEFARKKAKGLLVPYLTLSMFNYIFFLLFGRFAAHQPDNIFMPLIGIFNGIRLVKWNLCNGTMWFVLMLFWTQLGLFILLRDIDRKVMQSILVIGCAVMGYVYATYVHLPLIWSIDVVPITLFFVYAGYLTKQKQFDLKLTKWWIVVLAMLLSLLCAWTNTDVELYKGLYGNLILFVIGAFAGIIVLINISKHISANKMLSYIGKHSIIYLAMHQYIVFSVFRKITNKIYIPNTEMECLLVSLIWVLLCAIILIPVCSIIEKYFPFSIGKKKLVK